MLTHNIKADKSYFCSEVVILLFAVVGFNHWESPSQFENRIMAPEGGGGVGGCKKHYAYRQWDIFGFAPSRVNLQTMIFI